MPKGCSTIGATSGARKVNGQIVGYGPADEGVTIKMPDNVEDMAALPDLPDGFEFVEINDPIYGKAWHLGYRPSFGDKRGMTLDERVSDFTTEQPQPGDIGGYF